MARFRPFYAGVVESKHAETDVRKILGFPTELGLCIFLFDFGLNLVAGTTNAFFTDVAEINIAALKGICFLSNKLRDLHRDASTFSTIRTIQINHCLGGC